MGKKFRQAAANTFGLMPSLFNSVTVTPDRIIGDGKVLPINGSTRVSTSGFGYVCVDTNCDSREGKFVEHVYPRIMDVDGFISAIASARDSYVLK